MPPFILIAAVAAGALFGVKAVKREWSRINRELEETDRAAAPDGEARPTLRHDPSSGEWRPG